ncbi:sensor histidine kinase [Sphingobacterium pedocola]|nr:histidine kinase [Sphingobacterium pedocola]
MKGRYLLCLAWAIVIYTWWGGLSYVAAGFIQEFLSPNERLGLYVRMALENGLSGLFKPSVLPFYLLDFIYLVSLPISMKIVQAFVSIRNEKTALELKNTELALKNTALALNNVELELAFLKSQINPHFLFNTLNNIYILVTDENPKGAESITQLSGIMNYLLHESNRSVVPVDVELTFLQNYIELEKLRFSEKVKIDVHMESNAEGRMVVPLIIFPFIENAFKHGPKASNKNAWVNVYIEAQGEQLIMRVSNGVRHVPKPVGYIGGIGIGNVRKRLELNYGNSYTLNVAEEEDSYTVNLVLDLALHEKKVN